MSEVKHVALVLKRAAGLSFFLSIIKLFVYLPSGSLLVLMSLLDSLADCFASMLNHWVHRISKSEPDREHPFGHGGFEVVGSLVQGMVIMFFAASLFMESVRKGLAPDEHEMDYASLPWAMAVLLLSALFGYGIQYYLNHHIKKLHANNERSLSLVADHAHYMGDAIVNALSALGVLAIYIFNSKMMDVLFGGLGSLVLFSTGYPILKKCFHDIVHSEAPPELQQQIVDKIYSLDDKRVKGIHLLRSRALGPLTFVDFHATVDRNLSLLEAHAISEALEEAVKSIIPMADVLIHVDPDCEEDQVPWQPSYSLPKEPES